MYEVIFIKDMRKKFFLLLCMSFALICKAQKDEVSLLTGKLKAACATVDSTTIRQDVETLVKSINVFRQQKRDAKAKNLIEEADNTFDQLHYRECIKKAVELGSYDGLTRLAEWYQLQAANITMPAERQQWIDKAKECYRQQQKQFGKTSSDIRFIPDFYRVLDSGDTLYFRLNDGVEGQSVSVCTPAKFRCNLTGPRLVIPDAVEYQGRSFWVTQIGEDAFCSDNVLRHVTMPRHLTFIGFSAFKNCLQLDTVVFTGSSLSIIKNAAFPLQATFVLPETMSKEMAGMIYHHSWNDIYELGKLSSLSYEREKIVNNAFRHLNYFKDCDSLETFDHFSCHNYLALLCLDPLVDDGDRAVGYWLRGAESGKPAYYEDIADHYHTIGDYEKALKYYQMHDKCTVCRAHIAMMYARGEGVKQDFKKALKLVDTSIAVVKDPSVWYNLKGCIYMMMGRRKDAEACYEKGHKPYSFNLYTYNHYLKPELPSLKDMLFPEDAKPNTRSQQADEKFMQFKDEKIQASRWMADLLARSILELMPRGRYCSNRDFDALVNVPDLHPDSMDTPKYITAAMKYYDHMVRKVMSLGVTNYEYYTLPHDLIYHTYRDTLHQYSMLSFRPFVLLHRQMANTDTTTLSQEQLACYHQIEMAYKYVEEKYFNRYEGRDKEIVEALLLRHRNPKAVEAEYGVDGAYIKQLLVLKKKEEEQ